MVPFGELIILYHLRLHFVPRDDDNNNNVASLRSVDTLPRSASPKVYIGVCFK